MSTHELTTPGHDRKMRVSAESDHSALDAAWEYAKYTEAGRVNIQRLSDGVHVGHVERVIEDV